MLHRIPGRQGKAWTAMSVLVVSSTAAFAWVPFGDTTSRHPYSEHFKTRQTLMKFPPQHTLLPFVKALQCEPQPEIDVERIEYTPSATVLKEFGLQSRSESLREMPTPTRAMAENHAIFGTLMGRPGLVEEYRIFRYIPQNNPQQNDSKVPLVLAAVHLGPSLNGHDGIVHGGIISLLVDDAMGFGYEALPVDPPKMAVTANLNLNFRHPLSPDTKFIIQVFLQKREGRKIYLEVRVSSPDEKVLYMEGTSLYIVPRGST